MPFEPIEGFDYSAHEDDIVDRLADVGAGLAGRYLADDWRGMFGPEYGGLLTRKIPPIWFKESTGDAREFSGRAMGIQEATEAVDKLARLGAPDDDVVIFCTDWDAGEWEMDAIDDYLDGAASVLGSVDRVGIYGGFPVIDHVSRSKRARIKMQTTAWSLDQYGNLQIHPEANVLQYAYNFYLGGTNCDRIRALSSDFGQSGASAKPTPDNVDPRYTTPKLPGFYLKVNARNHPSSFVFNGAHWWPMRSRVRANHDTFTYSEPTIKSPYSGPRVATGTTIAVDWAFELAGKIWLVNKSGYFYGGRFEPAIELPHGRKSHPAR